MEVLAFDDEHNNHIMRSALYGQIFALKGVLKKEVAVYLLVGARVESHLPNRLHADQQTMICPRPPISLQNMTKIVEVCSGLGCLGIGLEHAGFEVVLRTDLSEPMTNLAKKIHPSPTMCADITNDVTMGKICEQIPFSCSLAAGVSCQPFSKLGDKRQKLDPRARTLPTVLRMSFLMRQAIVIIECVDEAQKCAWVQHVLSSFHQSTGYRVHQGLLHLQHIWPAKRSRWWCVVSHPMLGDLPWKPYPEVVNRPLISHVLDEFMTCTQEDLKQIELDTYELSHFEKAGFLTNEIALHSQMPTSLHSCGNQLSGCPCLCRKYPFSNDRLLNGGLHGLLVRMIGETKASYATFPRYRHIHPSELALLNGMDPALPWGDQLRLALAGLGQLASPLQSCWIGSSVLHQLSLKFKFPDMVSSPEESLLKHMAYLLRQRDSVFGQQNGANARVFQQMVRDKGFVMPNIIDIKETNPKPIKTDEAGEYVEKLPVAQPLPTKQHENNQAVSLSQGGNNGLSDVEFASAISKHMPAASKQWMSEAGGVMGFAVQPPESFGDPKPIDQSLVKSVEIPSVEAFVEPTPVFGVDRSHHERQTESSNIRVALLSVGVDNPIDITVEHGSTPSQLALGEVKLNPEYQSIAARSMVGTHLPLYEPLISEQVVKMVDMKEERVAHCPHSTNSIVPPLIPFPCTRVQALLHQQGWVACDEINYYFNDLQTSQLGKAIPVGESMSPQWFDDMTQIEPVGCAKFSAILNDGHWIPVTILYDETEIRITTTPEGKEVAGHLESRIATPSQIVKVQHQVLISEFAGDCGFQTLPWIRSTIDGQCRKPMSPKEAEFLRRNFAAWLFENGKDNTQIVSINMGGMNADISVRSELTQLLVEHGVFQDRVEERVNMLVQKIPHTTIQ